MPNDESPESADDVEDLKAALKRALQQHKELRLKLEQAEGIIKANMGVTLDEILSWDTLEE